MNEDDQKRRKTITSRGDGQDGMTSLSIMVTVCTKFSHTASCLTLTVATNRTSASPVTRSCPVPLSLSWQDYDCQRLLTDRLLRSMTHVFVQCALKFLFAI